MWVFCYRLFHLPTPGLDEGPDSISQEAAEQISAVPAASSRWLPVVNLRVLIQSSTWSESKTLVIFLIRLLISVVHIILVFWWRSNSYFFVLLTQPCLLMSVRILAWDENTVISFVIRVNIRILLCAYLTSHQLQGNLYIKNHSYYPNIGTSYKPNWRFIRRRCANRTPKSQWNLLLTSNKEGAWNKLIKKYVRMVYASTLQVRFVGLLLFTLIHTGAHTWCRHSSTGAFLLVYDLYCSFRISSLRKAWIYKGKVKSESSFILYLFCPQTHAVMSGKFSQDWHNLSSTSALQIPPLSMHPAVSWVVATGMFC